MPLSNRVGKVMVVVVLALHALAAAQAKREHAFYVAPGGNDGASGANAQEAFATLERARDAVRQLKGSRKWQGPISVYLRGGMYWRTEPLILGAEDSGTQAWPVTYAAQAGEKAVINGGRKIAGWARHEKNLWVAEVPEVKAGKWHFRQLFINGQSRRRARTPNEGFYRVAGFPDGGREVNYHTDCQRFEYASGDLDPNWTNLDDVEVIVYHFWTDSHLPIKSFDVEKRIVTFKHKAGKVFTDDFTSKGARYIVENVLEALDQPGEWYLDRQAGRLYYMPMPGEDMSTAEVIAPVAPALVVLRGDAVGRQFVEHVAFRNLSFMYTHFQLPPGNSNDQQGSTSVPAGITLAGARHCVFEGCTIGNLGTFAFDLGRGCTFNEFKDNEVSYVAAGGWRINGGTERNHPLERTANNLVCDNRLHHYGEVYPSAVGILLMNTSGNTIAHNDIHHGWYTGISIGWVWGYQRSISRDNVIEFNHIHHIGQGLISDMGAIYTLGVSPGTVIRNNLIHDVDANQYGGWGIYHDEGSTHLLVENNVVYNTKFATFNIHFAKEVTVRNNIFALGRLQQLSRGKVEPHKSVFFENNIVYWKEGGLLDKGWKDVPYTFHFHPKDQRGTRQETSTFEMDWNVYFNPGLKAEAVKFGEGSFEEWKKRGKDVHSVYADPMFENAEAFDFRLKPSSPALAMGFRPIDLSKVGPRPARSRP